MSPLRGNVCFASSHYGCCFSILTMAKMYNSMFPKVDPIDFAKLLWGDYYFNRHTRKFMKKATPEFK